MSRFLRAGAIAGAAGGIVMAVVLRLLGEGPIGDAITLESHHETMSDELYTRAAQQIGGMLGVVIYGLVLGMLLSIVLAAVRHRLPLRDDWARSITMAGIGFTTIALVPFLKYPANPPGIGDPDTITRRTVLYLMLLAFSVLAAALTWQLARAVGSRWARPIAVPLIVVAYVALIGVAFVAFPGTADKVDMPATLLWRFRLATLGGQLTLWSVLGLTLGGLLERPSLAAAHG